LSLQWTSAEDEILISHSTKNNWVSDGDFNGILLNRTKKSVHNRRATLGIRSNRNVKWSKEEKEILRKYSTGDDFLSVDELLKKLPNRTASTINLHRSLYGLTIPMDQRHYWTEDEISYLKKEYLKYSDKRLGEIMGYSAKQIGQKRFMLHLKYPIKTKKIYENVCRTCGKKILSTKKNKKYCGSVCLSTKRSTMSLEKDNIHIIIKESLLGTPISKIISITGLKLHQFNYIRERLKLDELFNYHRLNEVFWTDEELKILINLYNNKIVIKSSLYLLPKKTYSQIITKAQKLGL
jgi:hypothetical protein